MKRLLSLALAATLLGSTAAAAQGWGGHSGHGYHGHYNHYRGHGDGAAAIGLGIFALGALAIISSQNARHYDAPAYDDRYGPPPPPPPDNRYDNRDYPPNDGNYDDGYDGEN